MFYVIGSVFYLLIGILLMATFWKYILSEFANMDKQVQVSLYFIILVLTWGIWLPAIMLGFPVAIMEKAIFKREPLLGKVPIVLFIMMLEKMFERLWGVKLFPQRFKDYKPASP